MIIVNSKSDAFRLSSAIVKEYFILGDYKKAFLKVVQAYQQLKMQTQNQ